MNATVPGASRADRPVFVDRAAAFIAANAFEKTALVISRDRGAAQYDALNDGLGGVHIHYAVKANPAPKLIHMLVKKRLGIRCGVPPGNRTLSQPGRTAREHLFRQYHQTCVGHCVRPLRRCDAVRRRLGSGTGQDCPSCTRRRGLHPPDRREFDGRLAAEPQVRLRTRYVARASGLRRGRWFAALRPVVPCRLANSRSRILDAGFGSGRAAVACRPRCGS